MLYFLKSLFFSTKTDGESKKDNSNREEDSLSGEWVDAYLKYIPGETGDAFEIRGLATKILSYQNKMGTGGALYFWAGPVPLDGDIDTACDYGMDCSGSVHTIALALGFETKDEATAKRSTSSLIPWLVSIVSVDGDTVVSGSYDDVIVGDVACYDGHVAMVVGFDNNLFPLVLSMSGGGETTKGNNANARAKLMACNYRSDFVGIKRFPSRM